MIKRIFSITIILTIIATSLFFTSTAQAADPVAGFAAFAADDAITVAGLEGKFITIEYVGTDFIIGRFDMPVYEPEYDPLVYVEDGLIVAFYPPEDPAGKIVDVMARTTNVTLLEKAILLLTDDGDPDTLPVAISHVDFRNDAASLLLVAEDKADGNAFTFALPVGFTGEISYGFYQSYLASFTIDNEVIDQINFVTTNADFIGAGNYGTIFGHFDADPVVYPVDKLNEFTVSSGSLYAFGALAFEGNTTGYVEDNADFIREIPLTPLTIDFPDSLMPTAPAKIAPENLATDQLLNPELSWTASSAPNYEYCIDTTAPDADQLTEDCDTGWESTTATSVALSNLFFDTTYFWQVRAVNSTGIVEAGDWFSFTTDARVDPVDFAKIDGVLAEPVGGTIKLTMTWNPSYGAYYFEYCVDTTPDCIAPELWHNVGLATTATVSDLLLNTTYYWQVRAANYDATTPYYTEADADVWSKAITTRTFSKINPTDLAVYDISKPLMWEATPEALSYEYCYDTVINDLCDGTWKNTKLVTQASFKKLSAGDYEWQVRAVVSAGSTPEYEYANGEVWWEFTVLSKSSRITLFKVSPLNGAVDLATSVTLTWKATKIVGGYEYCYFQIDDTDTTPIADDDTCTGTENWVENTATSVTISGLDNATTYYWQVRANIGTSLEPTWIYADKGDYWAFTTVP